MSSEKQTDNSTLPTSIKNRVISFVWQHILLLISLYLMTLGVVVCIRSNLGCGVISSLPLSLSIAGENGIAPALTLGNYNIIQNIIFVALQIMILRRRFEIFQIFQLLIGWIFGLLIDLNMLLTADIACDGLLECAIMQFAGCTIMAVGIAFEVRCGSVTMPGEGLPVAISQVTGKPFPKIKIYIDTLLVVLAVASCYIFFGAWQWNIIGPGTLFAMIYVGVIVKFVGGHTKWFDKLLKYQPGFRRYIFGLAKYIYHRNN